MKLTKYFMPFAALALLASCSNDNLDAPTGGQTTASDDPLYLSLAISTVGTRTATPGQGAETGKDYENDIKSAYLFFVDKNSNKVLASAQLNNLNKANTGSTYFVRGDVSRKALKEKIEEQTDKVLDVQLLVVANLPTNIIGTDIENLWWDDDVTGKTLKLSDKSDLSQETYPQTFWDVTDSGSGFLMSNSEVAYKKIALTDIDGNQHHDISDPLDLGTVKVQRAMSRYDLNIPTLENSGDESKGIKFAFKADGTPLKYTDDEYSAAPIKLDFVQLAPFNMGNEFYVFKQVSENANAGTASDSWTWKMFGEETSTNYVKDPNAAAKQSMTGISGLLFRDLSSFKTAAEATNSPKTADQYFTFTDISSLTEADNDITGTNTELVNSVNNRNYYIWDYVAPATLHDAANYQLNGNAPGVVFKAEIIFATPADFGAENGNAIYAFDNVIYGSFGKLLDVVRKDNPSRVEQEMIAYFNQAKASTDLSSTANTELTTSNEAALKAALRGNLFQIYDPVNVPEQGYKYYCYYYYWNRHNDNSRSWEMGPMEFANVRNNIYKLNVNSVSLLGYPGDVPPPPTTKIEEDKLYMSVEVQVIDWAVRENNIDF